MRKIILIHIHFNVKDIQIRNMVKLNNNGKNKFNKNLIKQKMNNKIKNMLRNNDNIIFKMLLYYIIYLIIYIYF